MNNITISLHEDDRARLDRLVALLDQAVNGKAQKAEAVKPTATEPKKTAKQPEAPEVKEEPKEEPKPAEEATEEPTPADRAMRALTHPEPSVTLEQIQQKVMQLAVADGGAKKAKVREVISAYGAKVSDLKDKPEVWGDVWAKLSKIETEG